MANIKYLLLILFGWLSVTASLLMTLAIARYMPQGLVFLWLIWFTVMLYHYKTSKVHRYQHSFLLLGGMAYNAMFAIITYYGLTYFDTLWAMLSLETQQRVMQAVQLVFPFPRQLIEFFYILMFIYGYGFILWRVVLLFVADALQHKNYRYVDLFYQLGYVNHQQQWLLKPYIHDLKYLAILVAIMAGILNLQVAYWFYQQVAHQWLVWLQLALIALAVDWYYWLSGELYRPSAGQFAQQTQLPQQTPNFESLWRRYHQFWKNKWLVAGNRSTGGKER